MITFKTETGSTYEVDFGHRQIRRLGNDEGRPSTERLGADGVWKSYEELDLCVGDYAVILWGVDETPEGRSARCTVTSRVVAMDAAS